VYVVAGQLNYSDHGIQDDITNLQTNCLGDPWLRRPLISWWSDFQSYLYTTNHVFELVDGRIPPNKFYGWLQEFLFNDTRVGPYYRGDVVFGGSEENITGARFLIYSVGLNTTSDYTNSITSTRALVDAAAVKTYAYSVFMIYFEEYLVLKPETLELLGLALAGVFVVLVFFTGMSILSSLISAFCILEVVVGIAGSMGYWNIAFNPLSAVNLIMSVGLTVEFVAHFVRSFMKHTGTRNERAHTCLTDMGANVLGGGISNLLGIIVLAFAKYPVFNIYYFRMYLLTVLIGFFYGFGFLPVVLSLIGPSSFNEFSNKSYVFKATE